jgi:hypothetical protein
MSLPRSIDLTDLGVSNTVALPISAEQVVLLGPRLQTPKDTSFIVVFFSLIGTAGTSTTNINCFVKIGTTTAGTQIGREFTAGTTASENFCLSGMVTTQVSATDYLQVCLTAIQTGASATGTVFGASLVCISF